MFNIVFGIIYIILAIIQFSAMITGFIEVFGVFFGFIAAIIIAPMPIVGEIVGMIGAIKNWGWSTLSAVILFWGLPIFGIIYYAIDKWKDNNYDFKYNTRNRSLIKIEDNYNIISKIDDFVNNNNQITQKQIDQIKKENIVDEKAYVQKSTLNDNKLEKLNIETPINNNYNVSIFNGKWKNYKNIINIQNSKIILIDTNESIIIKEIISHINDYYILNAVDTSNSSVYNIEIHLLDLSELFIYIKKFGKEYLKGTFKKSNNILY